MIHTIITKKNHILYKATDEYGNEATSNISFERAEELIKEFFYPMSNISALV